jgi:NADH:ubiquinone oxidoreductase subunit
MEHISLRRCFLGLVQQCFVEWAPSSSVPATWQFSKRLVGQPLWLAAATAAPGGAIALSVKNRRYISSRAEPVGAKDDSSTATVTSSAESGKPVATAVGSPSVVSVSGRSLRGLALLKALLAEYPQRGFWGTLQALRAGRIGMYDSCFIGEDEYGNRYYENRSASYMRDRWCEYRDPKNADPAFMPPEWHAWLHHFVDDPPVSEKGKWTRPGFVKPPHPNYSGTSLAYAPRNSPRSPAYVGHLATSAVESWAAGNSTWKQRKPRVLSRNAGSEEAKTDHRLDLP